jgi:hypothetical protein
MSSAFTSNSYFPSESVVTPLVVPFIVMVTPTSEKPSGSTTRPVSFIGFAACAAAKADMTNNKERQKARKATVIGFLFIGLSY